MSKVDEIAEIAADGVADGMHIVSDEALAVEKAVRGIDEMRLAYIGLGVAIGTVVGGLIAFKVAYTRAEVKYNEIAAQEVADMRDHYNAKLVAREAEEAKPSLEEITQEEGYGDPAAHANGASPLAVPAPEAVVTAARFTEAAVESEWDEVAERRKRSPIKPYIIHIDEREDNAAYDDVTYTYYEGDDVLANEREEVIGKAERDALVGDAHLDKFGHGSGDANVVYVRNDKLEMDIEILRSPNSYAEEVHGFTPEPEGEPTPRRGRPSTDDE